jgi:hypothetical protein
MFEGLYDEMPLLFRVVMALIDYMIKASAQWRNTPEGAKEWGDFALLYEQMINNAANDNIDYGFEDLNRQNAQPAKPQTSARARQTARNVSGSTVVGATEADYADPNGGKR